MFGEGFDRFFLGLLNTGFAASVVILIVLLLRLVLRRAPKRYLYLLWAPALLRLLCPFSLESALSLLPANPTPIPDNIAQMETPRLDTGFVPLNEAVNAILPAARVGDSANPMQLFLAVAQLVWLAGAAGLLLYAALSTLRLRRQLKNAVCEGDNIYTVSGFATPFVMGILRPKIYLPSDLREEERGYILLHERTHLRRGDPLVRLAAFFAVCLHWFNPLVWLAYHLSGQDMEMSCDEAVVTRMGASVKRPYSASLLALASGRRWVGGTPLAFGEGDTAGRIKNILRFRRPAFWASALLAVLVTAGCIGLSLNPPKEDAPERGPSVQDSAPSSSRQEQEALLAQPVSDNTGDTEEDWVRRNLSSVQATPQKISLVIAEGLSPQQVFSVEITALIPREEQGAVAYTERVVLLEEQKTGAEWPAGTLCEGEFPYAECPDGTQMSVNVNVLAQEGENWIVSSWGYRSYFCEAGQLIEQVLPANTAVTVSAQERGDETHVTLGYEETTGEGFSVTLALPQGWTVSPEGGEESPLPAGVALYGPNGAEPIGWIGYDLLDGQTGQDPAAGENPVFYYSSLMLGSVTNWNNDYVELLREGKTVSATCLVGHQEGGAGGTARYNWGILARDEGLGRFIGIEIKRDALDQTALEEIARSIRFEGAAG